MLSLRGGAEGCGSHEGRHGSDRQASPGTSGLSSQRDQGAGGPGSGECATNLRTVWPRGGCSGGESARQSSAWGAGWPWQAPGGQGRTAGGLRSMAEPRRIQGPICPGPNPVGKLGQHPPHPWDGWASPTGRSRPHSRVGCWAVAGPRRPGKVSGRVTEPPGGEDEPWRSSVGPTELEPRWRGWPAQAGARLICGRLGPRPGLEGEGALAWVREAVARDQEGHQEAPRRWWRAGVARDQRPCSWGGGGEAEQGGLACPRFDGPGPGRPEVVPDPRTLPWLAGGAGQSSLLDGLAGGRGKRAMPGQVPPRWTRQESRRGK